MSQFTHTNIELPTTHGAVRAYLNNSFTTIAADLASLNQAVGKIVNIERTAQEAITALSVETNPLLGYIYIENALGNNRVITIPAATTSKAGLLTSIDKAKLQAAPVRVALSKQMALQKSKLLCLAPRNAPDPTVTKFRLTLLHASFLHAVEFVVSSSSSRYLIHTTESTGNLAFIEKIVIAKMGDTPCVVVIPSENLTNTAALPTLRLEIEGPGWGGGELPLTYLASTSTVYVEHAPTRFSFDSLVRRFQAVEDAQDAILHRLHAIDGKGDGVIIHDPNDIL